jgi:hypothetical protein
MQREMFMWQADSQPIIQERWDMLCVSIEMARWSDEYPRPLTTVTIAWLYQPTGRWRA